MNISGKKVYFLGDSITQGVGASDAQETSFVALFAKAHPDAQISNYGISGTRISRQSVISDDPCDRDFVMRAEQMPSGADLVVIFGGTNDFGHGDAVLGKEGDTDVHTFHGALRTLFELLLGKFPMAHFLVLTPLKRVDKTTPSISGSSLEEYVTAIKEEAAYFSLPVLDLYTCSGMNPAVGNIKRDFMPDGLHPGDAGHRRLFEIIDNYIKLL